MSATHTYYAQEITSHGKKESSTTTHSFTSIKRRDAWVAVKTKPIKDKTTGVSVKRVTLNSKEARKELSDINKRSGRHSSVIHHTYLEDMRQAGLEVDPAHEPPKRQKKKRARQRGIHRFPERELVSIIGKHPEIAEHLDTENNSPEDLESIETMSNKNIHLICESCGTAYARSASRLSRLYRDGTEPHKCPSCRKASLSNSNKGPIVRESDGRVFPSAKAAMESYGFMSSHATKLKSVIGTGADYRGSTWRAATAEEAATLEMAGVVL